MGNAGLQVSWSAEPFTARRRSIYHCQHTLSDPGEYLTKAQARLGASRRTRAVLISAMALGPVGRAYTLDWAARLRRRVKTFDVIAFTAKH